MTADRFNEILVAVQKRIENAKMRSAAVVTDALAVLERVRRARAARRGEAYTPESAPNFVHERQSPYIH